MARKTAYKNQYAAEKYDRISVMVSKGGKELIKKLLNKAEQEVLTVMLQVQSMKS